MNEQELQRESTNLVGLLNNPDTSIYDLIRLIEQDPVLTRKIMTLVNSARYGTRRRIISLNQAIVLIGFRTLRQLVEDRLEVPKETPQKTKELGAEI